MSCIYSREQIEKTIAFHDHNYPGWLSGSGQPSGCNVGCTFGKGNLIHQDVGKMAFAFFDRVSGRWSKKYDPHIDLPVPKDCPKLNIKKER